MASAGIPFLPFQPPPDQPFSQSIYHYIQARDKLGGRIPNDKKILLGLPGIGEYTASAIRAIAFGEREVVIDANIERVVCRLFKIEKPINQSKIEIEKY